MRLLLPWFDPRESTAALLGADLPNPASDRSTVKALFETQRAVVEARPPFEPPEMPVEPIPDEIAATAATAIDVFSSVAMNRVAKPVIIDLRRVLALQKAIVLDGIEERVATACAGDWSSLAAISLPPFDFDAQPISGTFDRDGRGITFSSPNPNMRPGPVRNVKVEAGRLVGFTVLFGLPYIRVTEYKGRYFLADGYHRTYGLIEHGITKVPCLLESASSLGDVTSNHPGAISHEDLMGPHPPLLTDFSDPDVSITIQAQAFRKVLRIRAEEFNIDF
jgi:hypothetical protein